MRTESLIQIEVADGFASGHVLGFFHGFFELFGQDVFLVGLLEDGVGELVFALLPLFVQDAAGLSEVDVGPGLDMGFVRKHGAKDRVDDQFGLAARANYVEVFAVFASHGFILRLLASGGKRGQEMCKNFALFVASDYPLRFFPKVLKIKEKSGDYSLCTVDVWNGKIERP